MKDHPGGSKTERASGRFRNRKTIRKEQKLKEDPEDSESEIEAGISETGKSTASAQEDLHYDRQCQDRVVIKARPCICDPHSNLQGIC